MELQKMELNEYREVTAATESIPESISFDLDQLAATLKIFETVSETLDIIKKQMFYSREPKNASFYDTMLMDVIEQCNDALTRNRQYDGRLPVVINEREKIRVLHCLIGLNTEAGETVPLINQLIRNYPLDMTNLKEELGDFLWYVDKGASAIGITVQGLLVINNDKLQARYTKGKFNNAEAIQRNLDNEVKIMSDSTGNQ